MGHFRVHILSLDIFALLIRGSFFEVELSSPFLYNIVVCRVIIAGLEWTVRVL